MKRTIVFTIILICIPTLIIAQSLSTNATYIKENFPEDYRKGIRQFAINQWGDDYEMVVYVINNQADKLVKLIDVFESEHTNIAFKAIQEWSVDGYLQANIKKFKEMDTFDLKSLIKINCDWEMVLYVYEKQVKAKSIF